MSIELLSEPIRRYIRDKRWEQLRPIQNAAITRILTTNSHYILASRTASGKTEAAFLPILSKVDFNEPGVLVLYVSPLIALINDQFERIEKLCQNLEVTVTKWHGEANKSLKESLVKNPRGIVLITPESLEAMFVNRPYQIKQLFSNLKYVVIDEIHSFIGTDRGIQLKSILSRLQAVQHNSFIIVGLSATLGDFDEAKRFTGNEENTKVLVDRTPKEIETNFRYFESSAIELPLELLKDIYKETRDIKALIFPNSRGRAEEVAVKLLKISDKVGGHKNYFSHHSSVDKQVREYVEEFAKYSTLQKFTIACTSTLELGIDIGTVDEVIQIDATHSIASLIQRIGRSGRKEGNKSRLVLYSTEPWSLLQSLACWLLYQEGYIEPPAASGLCYDILLHQALSISKSHSGIAKSDLINELHHNAAFKSVSLTSIQEIVAHLVDIDYLEQIGNEVIIGVEGEKIVNSRDFYTAFKNEVYFKVVNAGNTIGQIPLSPQVREDENILLAAKIWKIQFVDYEAGRIEVTKAIDGKSPIFFGGGADIDHKIRQKMYEIILSQNQYDILDASSCSELNKLRRFFSPFAISNRSTDRPVMVEIKGIRLYTFCGSVINRTLSFLFDLNGIKHDWIDANSSFIMQISSAELKAKWKAIIMSAKELAIYLEDQLKEKPMLMGFSKWGQHLPLNLKIDLLKQRQLDIGSLIEMSNFNLIENKEIDGEIVNTLDLTLLPTISDLTGVAEYDALPFRKFTSRSEADKAINSLKGILLGISLDGNINTAELNELNLWCTKHSELIDRNPFKEFMKLINDALQEESNRLEVINDLFWLCQKYETDSYYYNAATANLQVLQGICHGILADGIIDDQEVIALNAWLNENDYLRSYYPYDEIRSLVVSVLADGKMNNDERKRLLAYFKEFVDLNDKQLSHKIKEQIIDVSINGICSANPQLTFADKNFCFTGVSMRAKRSDIQKQIISLGGVFHNNVIKTTDYLIVGDDGNPCWAFACYGRKVEAAVNLRKQGNPVSLITELDFWSAIDTIK
jgi:ATP-dependent Lhr-like helicase